MKKKKEKKILFETKKINKLSGRISYTNWNLICYVVLGVTVLNKLFLISSINVNNNADPLINSIKSVSINVNNNADQ